METFYRQCFETMPCFLTVQDRELRIIEANRKFREDFGDFEGRHCYKVYKHLTERCEDCPVAATFEDGQCHHSEQRVRSVDGKDVDVIVYTTPLRDANGEISAVMEMSTDITEIKHMQKQLRESEERYHLLFEEVPCYISIQDRDLHIVEANRRFNADFGAANGRKCFEVYKHRSKKCTPCPVEQTFQDGETRQSEEVVTSISGEQKDVLVSTAPLRNAAGEIQGVIEMSTDISEIRELQSQLASIGLLVGSISHGIRGELSGLDGGNYLVKTGLRKNDLRRVEHGWEMIQRNFERIRNMVLNILYYARDREPKWELLSAVTIAEEAFDAIAAKDTAREVNLQKDFDTATGEFEADPQAVRSLLINLLDNAIDACRVDKKKNEHCVRFAVRGYPEHIEFEVEDDGIGMEREEQEKVFGLFFSSKGTEGTGLGLFVANKIAETHGGSIQVKSEIDKGTSFVARMPRRRPERDSSVLEEANSHGKREEGCSDC